MEAPCQGGFTCSEKPHFLVHPWQDLAAVFATPASRPPAQGSRHDGTAAWRWAPPTNTSRPLASLAAETPAALLMEPFVLTLSTREAQRQRHCTGCVTGDTRQVWPSPLFSRCWMHKWSLPRLPMSVSFDWARESSYPGLLCWFSLTWVGLAASSEKQSETTGMGKEIADYQIFNKAEACKIAINSSLFLTSCCNVNSKSAGQVLPGDNLVSAICISTVQSPMQLLLLAATAADKETLPVCACLFCLPKPCQSTAPRAWPLILQSETCNCGKAFWNDCQMTCRG